MPVPDEEQITLIRPSDNPEPPELVAAYENLWMKIEASRGKQGGVDTAAVIEANLLAVELSQYDGVMAEVFEILDAVFEDSLTGQSIEEIEEKLPKRMENFRLTGSHCPTCKSYGDCAQNCEDEHNEADGWAAGWAMKDAAVCVGGGAVGLIKATNWVGLTLAIGGKLLCVGEMGWDLYKDMKSNDTARELCESKCRDRFPKLDE